MARAIRETTRLHKTLLTMQPSNQMSNRTFSTLSYKTLSYLFEIEIHLVRKTLEIPLLQHDDLRIATSQIIHSKELFRNYIMNLRNQRRRFQMPPNATRSPTN